VSIIVLCGGVIDEGRSRGRVGKSGEVERKNKRCSGVIYLHQAGHLGHAHPSHQHGKPSKYHAVQDEG